ncbi:MAG: TonB-dependent receptor [Acidobacteria bacterium]|nr:TonB-dependent receptor [Acidobacteriota bacterium]MCB9377151.1 TonB-dependent receptor [Holophagales bacterium]
MKWIRAGSLYAFAALVATSLLAQTTGRIEGGIRDDSGAALPGVAVVATGPSLPGEARATTDASGAFRLVNLPPGVYTVTTQLDGFNTVEQRDVKVGIDRTVRLAITMNAAFAGELTVLGEAPVVDTSNATSGVSVSSETFDRLPLARDFYAVAQIATGAAKDAAGTSFYGSTGAENQYVIEGLNTTGGRLGTEGKTLNFDFIQEVEVKTGGLPAEYGRLTGGLINAITKSGGNNFEGNVFAFYESAEDNSTAAKTPDTQASIAQLDSQYDYGFSLGGAFIKDRLWFFGAYDRQERTNRSDVIRDIAPVAGFPSPPGAGSSFDTDTTTDLYSAKLTWRPFSNHSFALSIIGDPSTADGVVFPLSGNVDTFYGENETGSDDYLLRYDGVAGGSWIFEALAGHHEDTSKFSGPGTAIPQYIDRTGSTPYPTAGGFGYHENQENTRDVLKADVSKYFGSKLELKVGADREQVKVVTDRFNGGAGQRIYIFNNRLEAGGPLVYRHRYYVDVSAPGFDRGDPSTWIPNEPLHVEPETTNTSTYVQASWKPLGNLTFNLGFRWEVQDIGSSSGATAAKIDDNYSPRLQFVWDPQANGRSKLFGSYGRYYESIPLDINVRAFGDEAICFCYNFSSNPADRAPLDPSVVGFRSSLLGGATPVDPDLKGQYIDEVLLGYEYELAPNLAVGVQYTYRDLGRVVEDFLVDAANGVYAISNPGEGLGKTIFFYDYSPVPGTKATRTYNGVEVNLKKRYSNNWQLYASYLWSKLEGNYDGVFQASTGQLDPNINSAFDYADFFINADGKLSNDRTHTVKVNGSYTFADGWAKNLTLGLSAYWRSGTPLTAYGYSFGYSNWEYYLTPRGSLGRNPSDYEADLHIGYPIQIGSTELQLMVDVFNLLDRQSTINQDQRYNLDNQPFCAGIPADLCGAGGSLEHDGATLNPVGQLENPRATATNPDFLKRGTLFTAPRSVRFGLRLRF